MKWMVLIMCLLLVFTGCAMSNMEAEKTLIDGSRVKYKAAVSTMLQDLKATNIDLSLNPEGKTTVKAGAIDNTTNAAAADAIRELSSLIKTMLPLIAKTPVAP